MDEGADSDGDGVPDATDRCAGTPAGATVDEFGCTSEQAADSDGDGLPDNRDGCPLLAEDFDGLQDADGCPEYDNDLDGVCDPWATPALPVCDGPDGCPNVPEDFDAYKDDDGCPDPDNDDDGFPDAIDQCPGTDYTAGPDGVADSGDEPLNPLPTLTREDYDGVLDGDGCHDLPTPTPTPTPRNISVDIKPGSEPNSTNLGSQGVIPVAIQTTPDFDAAIADPDTALFEGASPVRSAMEDVDKDGDLDLIMHLRTQETDIADDATVACLTGETFDGQPIQGCDVIRIVPPSLDSDGDGFGDAVEASLRTDQFASCSRNPQHDAWPPDINNSVTANIIDILFYAPVMLTDFGDPNYDSRFDFNASGRIDIIDVLVLGPFMMQSCSNP